MFDLFKTKRIANRTPAPQNFLADKISNNNQTYFAWHESPIQIISVYDDKRYDRSDIDNLSPAMYRYTANQLKDFGFVRVSGRVFQHSVFNADAIIVQAKVQGASPFHSLDYCSRKPEDILILTPTQTAAVFINDLPHEQAIEKIVALIKTQPINLFKLKDHLENSSRHISFLDAIPYIKYEQRKAVESAPLLNKRALK